MFSSVIFPNSKRSDQCAVISQMWTLSAPPTCLGVRAKLSATSVDALGKLGGFEMALPRKFKPHDLTISSELKMLYGRPVLTSENRAAYDRMLLGLIECLVPKDCMERSHVKDIATYTREIGRY